MPASLVSSLVDEVADLLRHDNLDSRILTWVRMAYNDMISRMPVWRFRDWVNGTVISLTSSADVADISGATLSSGEDPVLGIAFDTSGVMYTPRYVPYLEIRKWIRSRNLGAVTTGSQVALWSIGPDSGQAVAKPVGRARVYYYPSPSATHSFCILARMAHQTTDLGLTYRYRVPYHMEHALVWGAAYFGAKFLRPQIAQIYLAEYEQALRNLSWILTFKPDATPVMRGVGGPYEGSSRLLSMPRIPTQIPSP